MTHHVVRLQTTNRGGLRATVDLPGRPQLVGSGKSVAELVESLTREGLPAAHTEQVRTALVAAMRDLGRPRA